VYDKMLSTVVGIGNRLAMPAGGEMSEAQRLNGILEQHHPAALGCMSALGRRAAMPKGIPVQAADARGTKINATIGQVTDGKGSPLPLPFMMEHVPGLDAKQAFLYAPIDGHHALREAWLKRQKALAKSSFQPELPITTHGLTHGLSILADMFADPQTDVILPVPYWENYALVFSLHAGAKLRTYSFFDGDRFNVEGLRAALSATAPDRNALVILNIPGNPTGFTPTQADVDATVAVLLSHPGPSCVVVDDAYQGTTWEPGLMSRSLFWPLAEQADPKRLIAFKVDGATKELFFFPSRIGFLTHSATGEAAKALLSKLKCVIRGTVGCPPGPSQAMVMHALAHEDLEPATRERLGVLSARYRALKAALADVGPSVVPYPFNSAYFALVGFAPGIDANEVRLRLIADFGVGTIYVPTINALRIAYCSTAVEDIPALVDALKAAVA
jgi:aspartate/methionine/tyrosine aminotransferase